MQVNCEFHDAHTNNSTQAIADRYVNAGGSGNFRDELASRIGPGNAIVLDDGMELIVVGGRKSICDAFGQDPVARFVFLAPPGKVIFASRDSSSRKGWAVSAGAARGLQMLTGPVSSLMVPAGAAYRGSTLRGFGSNYASVMRQTYNPNINRKVGAVLQEASKTRTVLHLFAESANFKGTPLGNRLTGALLALQLHAFFG